MEVLVTIMIVGVALGGIAYYQRTSWVATRSSNATLSASQLIERQVEYMRMNIAASPSTNWPPVADYRVDSATGITLAWTVDTVLDPSGALLDSVANVRYRATWQTGKADSLVVHAYLAKRF